MTVSSIIPVNNYAGNGSTTIFDFDFLIESSEELLVTYINEKGEIKKLKEGVDYSINEIGNEFGSYITFPLEQSSYNILKQNEVISLALNLEIKQESEFENSSYLNLKVLEWTFDYIVRLIQMINRKVDRAVKTYEGSAVSPDELIENLIQARNDAEIFSDNAQDNANIAGQKLTEIENIYAEATAEIENLHSSSIDDIQSDLTDALADINNAKVDAVSACEQEVEKAKEYSEETLSSLDEVRDVLEIANNRADTDLSNITSTAYDNLNQSKALATGDVSTNSIVYSDILNYAHSTFDLSKFTVVGSPTITDDGFVSNFTTTNYINTGIVIGENNFIIKGSFICSDVTKQSTIISISNGWYPNVFVNQGVFTSWSQDINGNALNIVLTTIQQNILYKFEYSFDGTKYTLSLFNSDNTLISTKSVESNNYIKNINTQPVYIGILASSKSNPFYGSIDLKSFAMWVDGIPVFNGNITGLDVIKKDNYKVVGNPTITQDGVASGFSTSNYVQIPMSALSNYDNWEICGTFNINSLDVQQVPLSIYSVNKGVLLFRIESTTGKITFGINDTGNWGAFVVSEKSININTNYYFKIVYSSSTGYILSLSVDNNVWENYIIANYTDNLLPYSFISIGKYVSNALFPFKGSIDLNSFKIYVDGNLVYQPCLKIPYTLSKTGSKIVDVAYRDRVQDLYSQNGEALYYTIDEQNQNFTLPMGEVYGMITQKANVDLTNLTNGLSNVICTTAPIDVEKDYGVSIIGSLTNNNNVLRGFSTSNYAQINTNFAPESNTWEMNFKVTTVDNVTSNQTICATSSESIEMGVVNSKFTLRINTGSTYSGTYTILTNTTYYIKVQYTGTQYILSYSLNGSSYTQDITISLATAINSDSTIYIGKDYNNNSQHWLGTVDLTGCNILVDNSQIWQGNIPASTSTASSQNPAVVIENYLNGTSGYRVWSDGYCEQWGYLSPVNQNMSYGISLLKSYKDNNYNVSACAVYEGSYTATAWIYSKAMSSFQLAGQRWADSAYTGIVTGVMWKTEGYIS